MNEQSPRTWNVRPIPEKIETEQEERMALEAVRNTGRRHKPLVVVCDLDGTLSDTTTFDPVTNDHIPHFEQEMIDLSKPLSFVVATARRANHSWPLGNIHELGFGHRQIEVIAENGGVLVRQAAVTHLAKEEAGEEIAAWTKKIGRKVNTLIPDRHFVMKLGHTMVVTRLQDAQGKSLPGDQRLLKETMLDFGIPDDIDIVHSGNSLIVQQSGISKATGFLALLKELNVARDEFCLMAIGDSENDISLFKEADLSVGVNERVAKHVDIAMKRGPASTKVALKVAATKERFEINARREAQFNKDLNRMYRDAWASGSFDMNGFLRDIGCP